MAHSLKKIVKKIFYLNKQYLKQIAHQRKEIAIWHYCCHFKIKADKTMNSFILSLFMNIFGFIFKRNSKELI